MNTAPESKLMKLRGIRTAYSSAPLSPQVRPLIPAAQRAEWMEWQIAAFSLLCPAPSVEVRSEFLERLLGRFREPQAKQPGADVQAQHLAARHEDKVHKVRKVRSVSQIRVHIVRKSKIPVQRRQLAHGLLAGLDER